MTLPTPIEMDSVPPPPPYTPRDDLTPSSSAEASPTSRNLYINQPEHGNDNGPSHDYSAYEQVLPETDPNSTIPDEPLPAYQPRSHRSNVDQNLDLPEHPHHSAVPNSPRSRHIPSGVARHSPPTTAGTARAPSFPPNSTRESWQPTPTGVSALQWAIDLTKQLSERSADQVARSVRAGLTPRRDRQRRPAPVRTTSSSSSSSVGDLPSRQDYRAIEDLDLTTLRTSIANLMRDPRNQDEIVQAVNQLRDDLHNRRNQVVVKRQVRDFKAEIHANRKEVRAMWEEAKTAKKAEEKERKREKRAEKRALKRGLSTENGYGF